MRFAFPWIFLLLSQVTGIASAAEPLHRSVFARNGWTPGDWILVKSPRWPHRGTWLQEDTHIRNATPVDATTQELHGSRAGETYTSMVLEKTFASSVVITAKLSFDNRMAPLIVLAPELGQDDKGHPEYREHIEIVFWDKGVNIWHHRYAAGTPSWKLAAYSRFRLESKTSYVVEVTYTRDERGKMLAVRVNGHDFGYRDDALPDVFHVGLTGCEGINRFYDLTVEKWASAPSP